MSKNDMVMVPRELAEAFRGYSSWAANPKLKLAHDELNELLANPAQHHQGGPVALPARISMEPLPDRRQSRYFIGARHGWNDCLDEIAKLGPLYTHPAPAVQQEPVMRLECEKLWGGDGEYAVDFVKPGWLKECREKGGTFLLYTHADPAEVEHLRSEVKQLLHTSVKQEVFDVVCKERDALRDQLTEADQLRETIRYFAAAHKDSQQHVAKIEAQLAEAQALLRDLPGALERISSNLTKEVQALSQVKEAIPASAEPSATDSEAISESSPKWQPYTENYRNAEYPQQRIQDMTENLSYLDSEPSAPVEIDERAEFDAWFKDHSKDWPFPSESIKCIARDNDWLVWQARASLARQP